METEAEDDDWDQTKMIRAHKILLAGTSPVFKANFFGPLKMTGEVMVVKETTMEALSTLIDFIYWPPGKPAFSLKHIACFEELCNIVEISERYQIVDLKQLAKEAIQNLKVTEENVITVATVADRFKAFADIQQMLINKNLAFLERTMKSADDVISFLIETNHDFPENGVKMLIDLFKEKRKKNGNNHNIKKRRTIWRSIFSKPEEHEIELNYPFAACEINEPCKQWRITLDFKPSSYRKTGSDIFCFTLPDDIDIGFTTTTTYIRYTYDRPAANYFIPEVPRIGEWTTIDVTVEELEPGKHIFTFYIGGRDVFRKESAGTFDLADVEACFGDQPGYIRNLNIMTK